MPTAVMCQTRREYKGNLVIDRWSATANPCPASPAGKGFSVSRRLASALALSTALTVLQVVGTSIPGAAGTTTQTTVTNYRYNVDGALTAVTTAVDDQAPTTTYLTWDNFVPDANDPTTGTVAPGNGRLVGYGPTPGTASLTERFGFDARDRLTTYDGDAGSETYDYHASGTMSSASTDGDTLLFYYDRTKHPQATNLYQTSADLWSGYLERVRYLSDGTEQVLLKPRKDMACTYDTETKALQSYVYDPFGASPETSTPPAGGFDLRDNPFRYAGEYRDPVWGGYYLRARWYHPDLQTFLSRDPTGHLNRYGYGAGNPVMAVDPSGMSFSWYKDIGNPLGHFLAHLNKGVGGAFARFFLTPLIQPLQILADPKGFWNALKHDKGGIDIFLALGIASSVGLNYAEDALGAAVMRVFAGRVASELVLGSGFSVASAAEHGFHHFNWNTLGAGLESTFGTVINQRLLGGWGYNRFNMSGGDVADMVHELKDAPRDTMLIFRRRIRLSDGSPSLIQGPSNRTLPFPLQTGPVQEALHLGFYHEQIIAVGKNDIFTTEILGGFVDTTKTRWGLRTATIERVFRHFHDRDFEFVGRKEDFNLRAGFDQVNPRGFPTRGRPLQNQHASSTYRFFTNNCQHHAAAVRAALGF